MNSSKSLVPLSVNSSILKVPDYPTTYLIKSNYGLKIHLQPWISGRNLQYLAYKCSMEFLSGYYQTSETFQKTTPNEIVELVPLSGSLFYDMPRAFAKVYKMSLNSCYIGASRYVNEDKQWHVKLDYFNLEAMSTRTRILLIGDTIATGATMYGMLKQFLKDYPLLEEIAIFSIAGAIPGLEKIKQLEEEFNITIYNFFTNGIFALADNGTDMFWNHPNTITSNDLLKRAKNTYEELSKTWCTIWDWGERCKNPITHLIELEERCLSELDISYSEATRKVLEHILAKTREEKNLLNEQISEPYIPKDLFL